MKITPAIAFFFSLLLGSAHAQPPRDAWKAGVAVADITPQESIWLAGYAARDKPSTGVGQPLYAKALALEDAGGRRVVIVTTDILGFTRPLAEPIAERLARESGLRRERLLLTSSHTHAAPVVRDYAVFAYGLTPGQAAAVERYSDFLQQQVVTVVQAALGNLAPARLSFAEGSAGFGINRRLATPRGYVINVNREGPVDPQVPVLKVESVESGAPGRLRALLFSYACHNTTLGGNYYLTHGDYSGFAQEFLERSHGGAVALFMSGCGGDINPHPRGTVELARQHGEELARSVSETLKGPMRSVEERLSAALQVVDLPWAAPPGREELEKQLREGDTLRQRHARLLLDIIEKDGALPKTYPYPVHRVRLGDSLTLVALGGEVVVDYPLRLKREITSTFLWLVAYANDVMGYIPSRRVLEEGGYEGGGSMIFYGRPGPWAPEVEEIIVRTVHRLAAPGS